MKRLAPFAGWTALVLGFLALLIYITIPELALWSITFAGIATVNAVFFLIVDRTNVKKALRSRQALYGMNSAVLIAVLLGILVFVNLLVVRHKQRFDYTETGFFTLAPQTQKILESLPRDVKLTAFFAGTDENQDGFLSLIEGYKQHTDKIEVTVVDPDKSPSIAKQYGVTTYGTVVLESGDKETKVKKPNEENLTNGLLKVTKDNIKKVYFLTGHGERAIENEEKEGYSQAMEALKQDGFEVNPLLLLKTAEVPADADLLIINGPTIIIPRIEQEAIEAYLKRGGSALMLLDPQVEVGMTSLLKRWGIVLRDDLIVDPMSRMFGGDYAAPVVNQYGKHGITNDFTLPTIFPLLRSVDTTNVDGVETTKVLFSGPKSWGETGYREGKVQFNEGEDTQGPVPVAVAATKSISGESNKEGGEKIKSSLVVIGDSDFATNQYFGFSGNGDFFLNSASWLLQEDTLISIRPRERKSSPLTLTNLQGTLTFVVSAVLFPGAVMLMGIRIWWRRRSL